MSNHHPKHQRTAGMSRNLRAFLGGGVIFYFIAMINDAVAVYVLSGVCLAVVAGCYWLSRLAVAGLELHVHLPRHEAHAGGKVPVQLQLENIGVIARPGPIIALAVTNQTIPALNHTYELTLPALAASEEATGLTEIVLPSRGYWHVGPGHIIGTDPMGMFRRPGPGSEMEALLVLPEVFEVPWAWRRVLLSPAARQVIQARTRHGSEFRGIRRHEHGDDLRDVHWKASAHRGELMVKEYAQGRDLTAVVWLDLRAANQAGEGLESSLELGVSLAASVVPALLALDMAVALVADGLPTSLRTPDKGEAMAFRVLRALAEVQARGQRPFAEIVTEQAASARPGVTVLVITSGLEPGLDQALLSARSRGIALRCVLVSPRAPLTAEQVTRQDELMLRLRHYGVPVVMADSRAELPKALGRLAMREGVDRGVAS